MAQANKNIYDSFTGEPGVGIMGPPGQPGPHGSRGNLAAIKDFRDR